MNKTAFISYSGKDRETAFRVCETLESMGVNCWIAPRDIDPGVSYDEEIVQGIESTTAFIILLSDGSNASKHVKRELELACNHGSTVYPIRIQEIEPQGGLKFLLAGVQWVDAWTPPLESHLQRLASILTSNATSEPALTPEPSRRPPNDQVATPDPAAGTTVSHEATALHERLLQLRFSAVRQADLFGAIVLGSLGLALPFVCRYLLNGIRDALAGEPIPVPPESHESRRLFQASLALQAPGIPALLAACIYLFVRPFLATQTTYFLLLIPLMTINSLGFLCFVWWFAIQTIGLAAPIQAAARHARLPDAESRHNHIPTHRIKALGACTGCHILSSIALLLILRDILFAFVYATMPPGLLVARLVMILAIVGSLALAMIESVKEILTELIWPADNNLTFKEWTRDKTSRNPARWYNLHFEWWSIYICITLCLVSVVVCLLGVWR